MLKSLLAVLILLVLPSFVLAKPVEVLVFPNGAIVTEEARVEVKEGVGVLSLPYAADPGSLKVQPTSGQVQVRGLKYDSELKEKGDFQALKDQIEATKDQLQGVDDRIQSKKAALKLWETQTGGEFETAGEVEKLAALMLKATESLRVEIARLGKEKKKLQKKLRELERKLAMATGRSKRHWKVEVDLKGTKGAVPLRFSYRVHSASWVPVYSLDARPEEKKIRWDWTANVGQSTARDWDNVRLLLATSEPFFTLEPPEMRPWIIREAGTVTLYRSKEMALDEARPASMKMKSMAGAAEPEAPEPVRQAGTLFDIYNLGKQTIKAGEAYRLDIRKGSWDAAFTYLTRPMQSPQAFLSAKLKLDELVPMPTGTASILVEGVFVGKRAFALLEKETDLPFGNDPKIAIKVTPARQKDEVGLFGNKYSQFWGWELEVTNNKAVAVDLRIEDARPQIQDKRIQLVQSEVPKPTEKDENLVTWNLNLKPGAKETVRYNYKIEYPEDMEVDLGR